MLSHFAVVVLLLLNSYKGLYMHWCILFFIIFVLSILSRLAKRCEEFAFGRNMVDGTI